MYFSKFVFPWDSVMCMSCCQLEMVLLEKNNPNTHEMHAAIEWMRILKLSPVHNHITQGEKQNRDKGKQKTKTNGRKCFYIRVNSVMYVNRTARLYPHHIKATHLTMSVCVFAFIIYIRFRSCFVEKRHFDEHSKFTLAWSLE